MGLHYVNIKVNVSSRMGYGMNKHNTESFIGLEERYCVKSV